jgi:thiamine-phosphate pyrophosphorylase
VPRPGFRLYLISDRKLAEKHGGLIAVTEAALAAAPRGEVAVQLREKDLDAGALLELARRLAQVCWQFEAKLIVNDRLDVAVAANADGIHLPANSFDVTDARRFLGASKYVGVSTHTPADVSAAVRAGADFAVFGPIFKPISKAAYGPPAGFSGLASAVRTAASMPVFALGGITPERIDEIARGLRPHERPAGAAVIGAVYGSDDPAVSIARFSASLRRL